MIATYLRRIFGKLNLTEAAEIIACLGKKNSGLNREIQITAIHSISTKTSLGRRETSTQARAGAVVGLKY